MDTDGFYERMLSLPHELNGDDKSTDYKIEFLRKLIPNGKVYKFISVDQKDINPDEIEGRLSTIERGNIWFSFFRKLNDKREFIIPFNKRIVFDVARKCNIDFNLVAEISKEQYDVYSLTYSCSEEMWRAYAGNGNGFCIEYDVENFDMLFPIEYLDKDTIDFTESICNAIEGRDYLSLALLPWVLKDKYNISEQLDSTKEKEVRILYSIWDKPDFQWMLVPEVKEKKKYCGIEKPYKDFGLHVSRIIIGSRCDEIIKIKLQNIAKLCGFCCEINTDV